MPRGSLGTATLHVKGMRRTNARSVRRKRTSREAVLESAKTRTQLRTTLLTACAGQFLQSALYKPHGLSLFPEAREYVLGARRNRDQRRVKQPIETAWHGRRPNCRISPPRALRGILAGTAVAASPRRSVRRTGCASGVVRQRTTHSRFDYPTYTLTRPLESIPRCHELPSLEPARGAGRGRRRRARPCRHACARRAACSRRTRGCASRR